MTLPQRKRIRLRTYDYDSPGCYFLTVCTRNKEKLLGDIVGTAVLGGPQMALTKYGKVVENQLQEMSNFYPDIKIDKFVVMPNYIHLLVRIFPGDTEPIVAAGGPPRTAVPTNKIARFIGTFKRLSERACSRRIWQGRSYDLVIRDEADYREIWSYIDQNPAKGSEDRFYQDQ